MRSVLPGSLAILMSLGNAVSAQQGDPVAREALDPASRMSIAVSAAVHERVKDLLDPVQNIALVVVAHQVAIAETCEGYEVDWTAFGEVMNGLLADLQTLTPEGQNNLAVDVVMHAYGIALGGDLAVAAYDTAAYCENAAGLRAQLDSESDGRFTVWAPAG
jgi:hypothetical protein